MKIIHTAQKQNAEEMIDRGYRIYQDVQDSLTHPFPVIILPRLREDFKKANTLLAVNDDETEVLGIALLEEIDVKESVGRFGAAALTQFENHLALQKPGPAYELGGIAVAASARRHGLGGAFYTAAHQFSEGRCVAVVTEANIPGKKTAERAGFLQLEAAVFNAPFAVKDGRAVYDEQGTHIVVAHLYAPKLHLKA